MVARRWLEPQFLPSHAGGHLYGGDNAEADEVFEHAGEGG